MVRQRNGTETVGLNWGRSVPVNQEAIGAPPLRAICVSRWISPQPAMSHQIGLLHFINGRMHSAIQKYEWCVAAKFPITANCISYAEMESITDCF
jgi:hypothetical protein